MNNISQIKKWLFAVVLGSCITSATIEAEKTSAYHHEAKTVYLELKHSLPLLQKLADGITNKKTLSDVTEVINYSQKVLKSRSKAKPRSVKKALKSTLKAIHYLKHDYETMKDKRTSTLETAITSHFTQIKNEMADITSQLQATISYATPIAIRSLPYSISNSGTYYFPTNLTYTGSQTAITISTDNVILNFYDNALTLTNTNATAISCTNSNECAILNGTINGIQDGSSNAVVFTGSSGISIQNTLLNGTSLQLKDSESVCINSCGFEGSATSSASAITIQGDTNHIAITSTTFNNWQNTIEAHQVTGLLIEDCILKGSDTTAGSLLTLGSTTAQANNVQIRDTSFIQQVEASGFDAVLFLNGSGALLENVLVDASTKTTSSYNPAAMHIGSNNLSYNNILAKACIAKGTNDYGLFIENGSYVTYNNCQFTDANVANIYMSAATGCLISHCKVSDAIGSGIVIQNGSTENVIANCDISNNSQDGLVVEVSAQKNQILKNNVFDNGNFGISNSEATSVTLFNMSCNNGVSDCPNSGIYPVQAPGEAPITPGSNVCCVP